MIYYLLAQLGWQSIDQRRDYFTACLMYKTLNNSVPVHISNEVSLATEIHDVQTRSAHHGNIYIPKPNIESFKKSLSFHGPIIWNALPAEMKTAEDFQKFKYLYKKALF